MRLAIITILIEILFLNSMLFGQDNNNWKLVKNFDNNIKAYVQKVPDSQIKKVKVETILEATLSELVSILKDSEDHHNWVFLNKKAITIEITDNFNWKYYGLINSPWPVSDRDFVTEVSLIQNRIDYSITITSSGIPEFLPKEDCCVRVPFIYSVWTFNPTGNDSIQVSLELEADLGGNIPVWLINMAVTKGPVSTMNGLIDELKKNKYKSIKLDYIREP